MKYFTQDADGKFTECAENTFGVAIEVNGVKYILSINQNGSRTEVLLSVDAFAIGKRLAIVPISGSMVQATAV